MPPRDAAIAQYRAMRATVAEVARVVADEGIDADIAVGGTLVLARSPAQLDRARQEAAEAADLGMDVTLLDAADGRARLAATEVLGATYTPHCAAVHSGKLVRGLAEVVEARGAAIYEGTRVTRVEPGLVYTAHGTVRAEVIVRATEGYTAQLPGMKRILAPVYSLVLATEPLPDATWDELGLRERETFSDHRHLIVYGQRTADGRMVFGGRGAPYHLGSRIRPSYDRVPRVFAALHRTLLELFPVLRADRAELRSGHPSRLAGLVNAMMGR